MNNSILTPANNILLFIDNYLEKIGKQYLMVKTARNTVQSAGIVPSKNIFFSQIQYFL